MAVALSAQTTDKKVNEVTPALFAAAPTPEKMVELGQEKILEYIREVGLAPTKAKNLWLMANQIVDAGGELIASFEFLESLAGVGHKTASVVMAQAFGVPAFPVDTHIHRLAARWGLSNGTTVERTEQRPEAGVPDRHLEPSPPADHLLRPRVLPGPAPRPHGVPDLQLGGHQEADQGGVVVIEPLPQIDCIDCGGRCFLLTPVPEDGIWEEGEVVAYRCEDCLDRWDLVLTADDDVDELRPDA